jgi:hypothetical protein
MAYNPSLPADHAEIVAAELRNQFAGLKALIDALQTQVNTLVTQAAALDLIRANAAANVDAVMPQGTTISNPPTQAQVQGLLNQLNALTIALHQMQA